MDTMAVPPEAKDDEKILLPRDSMVTVRLSEPPSLTVDTSLGTSEKANREAIDGSMGGLEELQNSLGAEEESPRITMMDPNGEVLSPTGSESGSERDAESRRGSDSSEASVEGGGVNWEELEKTEEKEPRDESSDDVRLLSPSS